MKTYHIQIIHALSKTDKIAQVIAAEVLLKINTNTVMYDMSDEATFHVGGNVN